jgi:hypothetical protein
MMAKISAKDAKELYAAVWKQTLRRGAGIVTGLGGRV